MIVKVKFAATVADIRGNMEITLPDEATLADLLEYFRTHRPLLADRIKVAYPISKGRTIMKTEPLSDGQEIVFMSALAGGRV